jgi:hypothetical protein
MKGKCAMRNRIVTSIIVALILFLPATVGAVNVHGSTNKIHKSVVIIPTHETSPTILIHRLNAFYSALLMHQAKQAFDAASVPIVAKPYVSYTAPTATTPVAQASSSGIPAAWLPTALCEEGGRNDPNYGYFGIKEWNGFAGYPTAGSAPLSVQLAWEAQYIGGPPDAPGQCHSY